MITSISYISAIIGFSVIFKYLQPHQLKLYTLIFLSFVAYTIIEPNLWFVLIFVTVCSFFFGKVIFNFSISRWSSHLLTASVLATLCPLLFFKYFTQTMNAIGFSWNSLIMPVGTSFFTFHALSYLFGIYYKRCKPAAFSNYLTYMSFFPHLTAGPISRPNEFMNQLSNFDLITVKQLGQGLRLVISGLFLKLVIADNLFPIVNNVYTSPDSFSALDLFLATTFFSFQVYGDFAGYTLIAIGSAQMVGINLPINFRQPYLSSNLPQFWRSWHITLSSWFNDYVFKPLQFKLRYFGNIAIFSTVVFTFILVGMWHGSSLNFGLFGLFHGILVIIWTMGQQIRKNLRAFPALPKSLSYGLGVLLTFLTVTISFVIFRSESLDQAYFIYLRVWQFEDSSSSIPLIRPFFLILCLVIMDIFGKKGWNYDNLHPLLRFYILNAMIAALIINLAFQHLGVVKPPEIDHFIYHKF
jgi:alginate O-acetyltransferase complex protein AlgI